MLPAACYLRDFNISLNEEVNWHWFATVVCILMAKLTKDTSTPGVDESVFAQSGCMMVSTLDACKCIISLNLLRQGNVTRNFCTDFTSITATTILTATPN